MPLRFGPALIARTLFVLLWIDRSLGRAGSLLSHHVYQDYLGVAPEAQGKGLSGAPIDVAGAHGDLSSCLTALRVPRLPRPRLRVERLDDVCGWRRPSETPQVIYRVPTSLSPPGGLDRDLSPSLPQGGPRRACPAAPRRVLAEAPRARHYPACRVAVHADCLFFGAARETLACAFARSRYAPHQR